MQHIFLGDISNDFSGKKSEFVGDVKNGTIFTLTHHVGSPVMRKQ